MTDRERPSLADKSRTEALIVSPSGNALAPEHDVLDPLARGYFRGMDLCAAGLAAKSPSECNPSVRLFKTDRKGSAGAPGYLETHGLARHNHISASGPALALAHFRLPKKGNIGRQDFLALCDKAEEELGVTSDSVDHLILSGNTGGDVSALYFRGGPETRDVIQQHITSLCLPTSTTSLLEVVWSRHPDFVELWVFDEIGTLSRQLSDEADALLNDLLIDNRPVARWRANFFTPVRNFGESLLLSEDSLIPPDAEERDFFLESAGRVLGAGTDGLRSWNLRPSSQENSKPGPNLKILHPLYEKDALSAPITAIRFHAFGSGAHTALLEWEIAQDHKPTTGTTDSSFALWRHYLAEPAVEWSLAKLIDFIAEARFVKHHYPHLAIPPGRKKQQLIAVTVTGRRSNQMLKWEDGREKRKTILDLLPSVPDGLELLPDGDDRAAVFESIIVRGGQASDGLLDPRLSELALVDPYLRGGLYDAGFAREEFARSQYRRFWDKGTHYMATSHSFAMMTYRHDDRNAAESARLSFGECQIHSKHMRYMYHRLFLLCRFQKIGLDEIGREAGKIAAGGSDEKRAKSARDLRHKWIDMRTDRWFVSVSTQLQGEEIYRLMHDASGIDEESILVNDKISELEAVYSRIEDKKNEDRERRDSNTRRIIEVFGVPIAVFIAIRETMYSGGDEFSEGTAGIMGAIKEFIQVQNSFFFLSSVAMFWSMVLWLIIATKPFQSEARGGSGTYFERYGGHVGGFIANVWQTLRRNPLRTLLALIVEVLLIIGAYRVPEFMRGHSETSKSVVLVSENGSPEPKSEELAPPRQDKVSPSASATLPGSKPSAMDKDHK